MNSRIFIFAALIISLLAFSFISCDQKEDDASCPPLPAGDDDDAVQDDDDDVVADDDDDDDVDRVEPVPSDDAFLRPGPIGDGRWILPNGRMISPVGQSVKTTRFPMSLAAHSTFDYLYTVAGAGNTNINVINTQTMQIETEVVHDGHFGGMILSDDESVMWVGGGNRNEVREYYMENGIPVFNRSIPAPGYPTDIELSSDEKTMYVSMAYGNKVSAIDVATGTILYTMNAGTYTYNVAISEGLDRAITTNWGTWSVSVFRLSDGVLLADILVGKNPEGVVIGPDGSMAYVACSDTDDVYEIDLQSLEVTRSFPLYPDLDIIGLGAFATELVLSPDGKDLYVVASGFNSIDVINIQSGKVTGRIPTQWYPTNLLIQGNNLFVVTANGLSVGSGTPTKARTDGSAEIIDLPDEEQLAVYTEMVLENNIRTSLFYDDQLMYDSPIPSRRGHKSDKIKHVVFILKENKTFDQVMADMPGVEADPSLLIFGEYYTPNLHALAAEFSFSDNYYSESHDSDLGHSWATAVMANDYVEKLYRADGWTIMTGVEPAAVPASKTVFHNMHNNGVSFRVYGEVVGTMSDIGLFGPYIDFNYGFYSHATSDRVRAAECIREWEAGIFPEFIFILMPNDHAEGTSSGAPTMEYFVADNDAGMGMVVDWIIHSKHWPETAIFITQDDPQSGSDHIDPHRTPLTVVSPYSKRKYVSHVHHSMSSLWLTFELILGLPQVTNYDRFTAPLYDFFQPDPVLDADFTAIPSNVPYEENPKGLPWQEYCDGENWDVPDQVERIDEVVWAYMKPGVPYPHQFALPEDDRESEEEEEEEGAHYRMMMNAYIEYANKNNLIDPELDVMKKPFPLK